MQAVLARGKSFRFRALGWSMLLFTLADTQISAGELADLRAGDIIATETAADSPAWAMW